MPKTPVAPYYLHIPLDGDLADVPSDIDKLAATIATALNLKLDKASPTDTVGNYQRKIEVRTDLPGTTAGYVEGAIIFVYQP